MGMTMTQKILAKHAGLESVKEGQLIKAKLDLVLGNDITSPVAINEFRKAEFSQVFDKYKVSMVMDHFAPAKDIKAATQCQVSRNFADEMGIHHFYDVGEMGIEHALLPEKGIVGPGELIIGADSHTCTYGALGAFSTGVGSTDMAAGMATGECWFKVPSAIKFNITGMLKKWVTGKDIILHIIGMIGVDGALYKSMEYVGDGIKNLSIFDRLTMSNMAIEAGAKNGIFIVDDITLDYVKDRVNRPFEYFYPDDDAVYEQVIDIDLSQIKPTIAFPHLPSNTRTIDEVGEKEVRIDQVVIGSCTNGFYSDLAIAAKIIKGKRVAKHTRAIVIPATQDIYMRALKSGVLETFMEAGFAISTPTCGPCLGGHMGILAPNEKALTTTNRNFVGRMGHPTSEIHLASPAIAAATAIKGYISGVEE